MNAVLTTGDSSITKIVATLLKERGFEIIARLKRAHLAFDIVEHDADEVVLVVMVLSQANEQDEDTTIRRLRNEHSSCRIVCLATGLNDDRNNFLQAQSVTYIDAGTQDWVTIFYRCLQDLTLMLKQK